ncbi:unnamed protein product [Sphagnum jensenii]|jgi:hypothetical protein|uniref:RING-type domain-containing protein n=1 Tax=Sphagnum jensenii TaxID=128206 RepID=A0ABP0WX60_9BRYO
MSTKLSFILVLFVCVLQLLLGFRVLGMSSTSSSSRPLLNSNAQLPADTSTTVAAAGSSSTHDDVLAGAADPKLLPPAAAAAGGSSLQIEAAGAGYSEAVVVVAVAAAGEASSSSSSSSAAAAARSSNVSPAAAHINPSVLVIVVILSVVFILSGFLHLLARCLGSRSFSSSSWVRADHDPPYQQRSHQLQLVSALHGQLQQLFHLHDAGVEQAFIDTLPVFAYASIHGLKDGADCAVCLNEFGEEDRLRLLPKCKHAFHTLCIDTWLLSNSTCPLCRRSLLPDPIIAGSAPLLLQPQAGSLSLCTHEQQLIITGAAAAVASSFAEQSTLRAAAAAAPALSFRSRGSSLRHDSSCCRIREEAEDDHHESCEIQVLESPSPCIVPTVRVTDYYGIPTVLKVELGKVKMDSRSKAAAAAVRHALAAASRPPSTRNSSNVVLQRAGAAAGRSYSMGSYEYVVDPSNLELMIAPTPFPGRPQNWAPSRPTHRSALSDSIPELASASGTPAKDDLFWASRGLYTPHTLSRVRELLSPSPGRNSSRRSTGFFSPVAAAHAPGFFNMEKIVAELEEEVQSEEEACSSSSSSYSSQLYETQTPTASYNSDAYLEAVHSGRSLQQYLDDQLLREAAAASGSLYFEAEADDDDDEESQSEGWSDPLPDEDEDLDEALSAVAGGGGTTTTVIAAAPSDLISQTHESRVQSFRARFQAALRAQLPCATETAAHGTKVMPEVVPKLAADEHNKDHNNNADLATRSSSLSRLPDQAKRTSVTFYRRRSLSETSAGMDHVQSGCNSHHQQQMQCSWIDIAVGQITAAAAAAGTCHHDHDRLQLLKVPLSCNMQQVDESAAIMSSTAGVPASSSCKSKRYTLQWLMGRNSRLVYSAATPSPPPPQLQASSGIHACNSK